MKTLKLYHGKQLLAKIGYERKSDLVRSVNSALPLLLTHGLIMNTQNKKERDRTIKTIVCGAGAK